MCCGEDPDSRCPSAVQECETTRTKNIPVLLASKGWSEKVLCVATAPMAYDARLVVLLGRRETFRICLAGKKGGHWGNLTQGQLYSLDTLSAFSR